MLQKLVIKNYAIIDELTFTPDSQLNVITGETGAGKSIIIGALSLILGARADTTVLINKEEKCIVEATFDVRGNKVFRALLTKNELDEEDDCVIRREINKNGKSRAFINDTPVNLTQLNDLTSYLVDLHQQFDHLALADNDFQMNVLDAVAENSKLKEMYRQVFSSYTVSKQELASLKIQQAEIQKEYDYKHFLFEELSQASFTKDEIENAEQQLKQVENAEHIHAAMQQAIVFLEEGETPVINELRRVSQSLEAVSKYASGLDAITKRLNSAQIELKDIVEEIEALRSDISVDDELMHQLSERVDLGYKLLKKHSVNSTNQLLEIQEKLSEDLGQSVDLENKINTLEKELAKLYDSLIVEAKKLTKSRASVVDNLVDQLNSLLVLVGMPNARLSIDLIEQEEPTIKGKDDVAFLFDANKSGQFNPMHKVASGGEMSRIMLCIKSIIAKAVKLPTLIFDEVDTGISGEAAKQVGILLKDLSALHQVICITHQPQIAARGSRHFYVYKEEGSTGKIKTNIRVLEKEERVNVIASMIGGDNPSSATIKNAKELIAQ
ncbi:MAG: DNA repair protein RecN [Flavipsychrobacter sp.]